MWARQDLPRASAHDKRAQSGGAVLQLVLEGGAVVSLQGQLGGCVDEGKGVFQRNWRRVVVEGWEDRRGELNVKHMRWESM